MKTHYFALVMLVFFLLFVHQAQTQTLYDDVGHIDTLYQETWNVAGLLQDMSSIEPKTVYIMTPGEISPNFINNTIATARNWVGANEGVAVIYFPAGTYYFTDTISLSQIDSNIVFQGAGSDRNHAGF